MSEYMTIGTCSLCGGDVVTPSGPWSSILPPPIRCSKCGAVPAAGPIMPMKPAPQVRTCNGPCFCTGECQTSGTSTWAPVSQERKDQICRELNPGGHWD